MTHPLPQSPPPPVVSLSALFRLRPGPNRVFFGFRAALAMGLCVGAGWLAGDEGAGLLATLGAFAALYGSGRPYRHRAALLAIIGAGLVVSVVGGVAATAAASAWPGVLLAAVIAFIAAFLCSALIVGPPGAYLFALAAAAGTHMHGQAAHLGAIAVAVAAGAAVAWALQMVGALWRPRWPEETSLQAAAGAVAAFAERASGADLDLHRHATALALHEAWLNLVARQPGRAQPNDRLHRLRALNRELHRIFGAAIAGEGGRDAASAARAIGAQAKEPPPVPGDDALYKPLAYITSREMLAMSFRPDSTPMRIASRVGAAALIAGGIGALMGLDRAYWAIAASVLMLYQGLDLTRAMQRGLERTLGTFAGLGLAAILLSAHPHGLALAAIIMVLQFLIEIVVVRNYALATIFITPIALTVTEAATPAGDIATLLIDRGVDTAIGCAVGLVVLFATSRRSDAELRKALDATISAARALLPMLAANDATSAMARRARIGLRNAAVDMMLLYEAQTGMGGRAREEADRLWPAIVAAQRLAFRMLAACWELEASGARVLTPEEGVKLDEALSEIMLRRGPVENEGFLASEMSTLHAALLSATALRESSS
ncbi:MAG: FUSC family protein [Methylobacteriaceae bacterium]|nr:FUSC family protein [Rhodoblastus sp.]MCC0006064.1 FUSC family protein [Methylobacteriaceae bacterium]